MTYKCIISAIITCQVWMIDWFIPKHVDTEKKIVFDWGFVVYLSLSHGSKLQRRKAKVSIKMLTHICQTKCCHLPGDWCHNFHCQKIPKFHNILCGNKMPTRCNRGFYCRSYCLFNILQTGHITLSSTPDQLLEKTTAQNTTCSNHCIILLSSWWWA